MTNTPETDEWYVTENHYGAGGVTMTDTPETDQCVKENRHIRFLEDDYWSLNSKATYTSAIVCLCRKLERQRDEAVSSCHIWQKGHAELVSERDYLLNLLQFNQPERKHIGRWGHNKEEFTSPYIKK